MIHQAADPLALNRLFVTRVDPAQDVRWLDYVNQHPEALVYHHPRWFDCLAHEYRHFPEGLLCQDQIGEVRGVLPLMETEGVPLLRRTQLASRRISSLPRTPLAGPLSSDCDAKRELVSAAVGLLSEFPKGTRLELKGAVNDLDSLVPGLKSCPWRDSYVMTLPDFPDQIRFGKSRNHGRIRWAVNKASRIGLTVRRAESLDDVRTWYELYLDTMRWHANPPRPFRLFEGMWRFLAPSGMMRLLMAEKYDQGRAQLLAGSIFLMHGRTVFYAFNGRRRDSLSLRPNDLIQWHAIHDACAEGYRHYDFGEVAANQSGLAKFKEKWGVEPERLYRAYYPAPDHPEAVARDGHSALASSVNAVWRHTPLRITAALGDRIYRYF